MRPMEWQSAGSVAVVCRMRHLLRRDVPAPAEPLDRDRNESTFLDERGGDRARSGALPVPRTSSPAPPDLISPTPR